MTKKQVGRPTDYSEELVTTICEQIALGNSLRSVAKADGIPAMGTIMRWLAQRNNDGTYKYLEFRDQYERACQERTEAMAEDILDIADNGTNDYMEKEDGSTIYNGDSVQRSRLRVDTRKWLMSKMKPKKYGDKVEHDMNHHGEVTFINAVPRPKE